ncbi:hypothetical protein DPMN_158231 [Dreissena polymorpha]|uniref:Uncharacterized protein n=1 Tax=Dreissena polymorpha TaxID=45954 RepID=A0A9D4EKZ7_DREPO|nr:hypothetical protein DPMN_158231 [Dreissena polymorpha]
MSSDRGLTRAYRKVRDYYGIMGAGILKGVFFGIPISHTPAVMYEAAGHARYPQAMSH